MLHLRLSLRFLLAIAVIFALTTSLLLPVVDAWNLQRSIRDLDAQSQMITDSLKAPLAELVQRDDGASLQALLNSAVQEKRHYALAYCDLEGHLRQHTPAFPQAIGCQARNDASGRVNLRPTDAGVNAVHVAIRTVQQGGQVLGFLVFAHDMSYIEHRASETRGYVIAGFAAVAVLMISVTLLVVHLSWRSWMAGLRAVLRGENPLRAMERAAPEVRPLLHDLSRMLRDSVDGGSTLRDDGSLPWGPDKLRRLLREQLYGDEILVVSNREPYVHVDTPHGIEVLRPASGLVTAVEPVMRACSGTWIAHGNGSADKASVDARDRIRVPPEKPGYTLRRIWLSEEEERGYYYGFANEGIWPLCHIAHVRPIFRSDDWEHYVRVNQRFADAVVEEASTRDPVILVQDYHFALLPRMIRERLPRATVITFWHIPWPNPESFGICPWRNEILEGLLGSTILGFHTPYHRKNFIETVDRFLETRIEHEHSTVSYRGELTLVQDYPISIHWPDTASDAATRADERATVRARLGMSENHRFLLGVDRLDYTKGIIERFEAVERLLEKHPEWIGRISLLQIAAPSRSLLRDYQEFANRVRECAERINQRYADAACPPIRLQIEQHGHDAVFAWYRACDICMVTSLHDGMNLVAKEFVASRDDEAGVLILSQFAGAAGELREALIINPYDREETADALYRALVMAPGEQRERMRSMRTLVRDCNIYRWAGRMLLDAANVRQQARTRERIYHQNAAPRRREGSG